MTAKREPLPPFSHESPVSQAGFTMIPNAVVLRGDLSLAARLLYGYLKHLAWRNHTEGIDPPLETLMADLGVGKKVVIAALKELTETGLVRSVRRGQGRTNVYVVVDPGPPSEPLEGSSRSVETALQEVPHRHFSTRARSSLETSSIKTTPSRANARDTSGEIAEALRIGEGPPPLRQVEGQNLGLNALCEVCELGELGGIRPREKMALAYLNGRAGSPGIRAIFWAETVDYATREGKLDELAAMTTEQWEQTLADSIRKKAVRFRERMPDVTMGPKALRDWWLDLAALRPAGGATPDDFRRQATG